MAIQSGTSFGQAMVDQRPVFDRGRKKKGRRPNQVIGKGGIIIRPDKRKKVRYL